MNILSELSRRGVLRTLVVYVGVGWGLVQGADFFVTRYQWTDALVDLLLVGLLALLPLVLWLAWQIGAPGRLPQRGKVWLGSAVYTLATIGVLTSLFGGTALGKATTTVQVTDEAGQTISREVPRQDLLRALAVAPFRSGDAQTPRWLSLGLTDLLTLDLSQHRFLVLRPLYEVPLRDAARKNGGNAPLAQKAVAARDAGARFLLDGQVSGSAQALRAQFTLYQVEPVKELTRIDLGPAPLDVLTDLATAALKPHLDLSAERAAGDYDLPVRELLTGNDEALQKMLEANVVLYDQQDVSKATALLQQAMQLDPGFAMAGLRLYSYARYSNQRDIRVAGIAQAMGNLPRLTEPLQCQVRTADAIERGQMDRAQRLARSCVELFPYDVDSRRVYAAYLALDPARIDQAIAQFQALYDLGPANDSALLEIATLRGLKQDLVGATESLSRYRQNHPDDDASAAQLAELQLRQGNFEAAREVLLDAQARKDSIRLATSLAGVYQRQGRFAEAEAALASWQDNTDLFVKMSAQRQLAVVRGYAGREHDAEALRQSLLEATPLEQREPLRISMHAMARDFRLRTLGWPAIAADIAQLLPGTDLNSTSSRELLTLQYLLEMDDRAALAACLEHWSALVKQLGRTDLEFWTLLGQARLADLDQQATTAGWYAQAYQRWQVSTSRQGMSELWILVAWLRTGLAGAPADAVSIPRDRLRQGFPGLPLAQLALAELEFAEGNAETAATRVNTVLQLLADADTDAPVLHQAQALRDKLAALQAAP